MGVTNATGVSAGPGGGSTSLGTMTIPVIGPGQYVSTPQGVQSGNVTYLGSTWWIGTNGAVFRDGVQQSTGAGAPYYSALCVPTSNGHLYGLTSFGTWWYEGSPWTNMGTADPRLTSASANILGNYQIGVSINGLNGNEECSLIPVTEKFAIAAGAVLSKGIFKNAATASTVYTIYKNGVSVGTATIAASGTTPTFSLASTVVYDPANNDVFEVIGPATADATLSKGMLVIMGTLIQ